MLLGTIATSLLGSALTGRGVIRPGEGAIRAGLILYPILKYKNIKINLNLMVFIQEFIDLK